MFASEPKKDQRLDAGLVRQTTGGDDLTVHKNFSSPSPCKTEQRRWVGKGFS
jgi:hypothetical protein